MPCARISLSATFAAHGPIGAESDSSSETGVVAPIVTRDPSRVIPASPAPVSSIARSGRSLPLVSSGTTIVPPPITVTPASKRETASSGDDGWSTSGAVIDHPSFGISLVSAESRTVPPREQMRIDYPRLNGRGGVE